MADENEKFNSIQELYTHILPALQTKRREFALCKINYTCKDIWNFCVATKWRQNKNLRLYEMVDDILKVDLLELKLYLNQKEKEDD